VLDIDMPGRSGLDVARDLTVLVPGVRIVFPTGSGIEELLIPSVTTHLPKPADVDELLAAMDRVGVRSQ
jgi:DNA-binding NarL/FixJ family response regulator